MPTNVYASLYPSLKNPPPLSNLITLPFGIIFLAESAFHLPPSILPQLLKNIKAVVRFLWLSLCFKLWRLIHHHVKKSLPLPNSSFVLNGVSRTHWVCGGDNRDLHLGGHVTSCHVSETWDFGYGVAEAVQCRNFAEIVGCVRLKWKSRK